MEKDHKVASEKDPKIDLFEDDHEFEEFNINEGNFWKPNLLCILCERIDRTTSFQLSKIEDGDIICFQKSTSLGSEGELKYSNVPSFLVDEQEEEEDKKRYKAQAHLYTTIKVKSFSVPIFTIPFFTNASTTCIRCTSKNYKRAIYYSYA
ncbi:unnamed protein product [Malus baccata var. baccata]